MIQDKVRINEKVIIEDNEHINIQDWYAGPRFMNEFKLYTNIFHKALLKKIEMAIYTSKPKSNILRIWYEFGTLEDFTKNKWYSKHV